MVSKRMYEDFKYTNADLTTLKFEDEESLEILTEALLRHSLLIKCIILSNSRKLNSVEDRYIIELPYIRRNIMELIKEYLTHGFVKFPTKIFPELIKASSLLQVNYFFCIFISSFTFY